jgi:hypothetical protein
VVKDNWSVSLSSCNSVLSSPSAAADSGTFTWDVNSGTENIYPVSSSSWTSWSTYFSNTDSANCPITACALYESGCSTALTSPVSIASSSPWLVTAEKGIVAGYTQSMCV